MRLLRICLNLILVTTCFGQAGNVNLKPLPGMQFVNRTHRLGRGLVGMWMCNERSGTQVFDLSGNGNHGVFGAGAASPSWTSGKFGPALDFDGVDDRIVLPDMSTLFDTEATLVMYHYPRVSDSSQGFLTFNTGEGSHYPYNDNKLYIATFNNARIISAYIPSWTVLEPHHLAITTSPGANNYKLYHNGVLDSTYTGPASVSFPSTAYIGYGGTNDHWDGQIEYIVLYNRVLSASEIALFYRELFCMFEKDDIALMVEAAAPPPSGGQVIIIQMSMIPIIFFTLFCFIKRKRTIK